MQTMADQGGDSASDHSSVEGSAEWYSFGSGPPPSSDSDPEDDGSSAPFAWKMCLCDPHVPCDCDTMLLCSYCGSIFDLDTHCPLC